MNVVSRLSEIPPTVRWYRGVVVSRTVHRHAFASFGARTVIVAPMILKGVAGMHIGDDCVVREGAWFYVEEGGGPLRIGDRVSFAPRVHVHAIDRLDIGHDVVVAEGAYIGSGDHGREDRREVVPTGPVRVGSRVFVGQRAIILGGVTVGDGATIAAGAVVTKDVPAGATVAGVPARPVRGSHA